MINSSGTRFRRLSARLESSLSLVFCLMRHWPLLWTVLGIGSRLFARFFASASAWRVLDGVIAVVMAGLAISLAVKGV